MGERGEILVKKNHEVGDSHGNSPTMCYSSHPAKAKPAFSADSPQKTPLSKAGIGTEEPIYRAGIEMQMWRTDLRPRRGRRGWEKLRGAIDTYPLPHVKEIASGKPLYNTGSSVR